jgi:LacI family transcriptional regulator
VALRLAKRFVQRQAMPTIRDVARAARVSIATVSAVINRSAFVSETLEARVRQAIAVTGYRPHALARALKTGSGRVLGLVLPDLAAPSVATLAAKLAAAAQARDHQVLLEVSEDDPAREAACLERLRAQRTAGVLLMPAGAGPAYAAALKARLGAPAILLERTIDGLDADAAGTDHETAASQAAARLVELGHRRIALIAGPAQASSTAAQLDGFRAALAFRSVAIQPRLARIVPSRADHAAATARALLAGADPPSAIVAGSAAIALGVLATLTELGLRVPMQVSLLCLEDADWMGPHGLGAIAAAPDAIAQAATGLLFARMAAPDAPPRRQTVAPRLDPRASCAPPPLAAMQLDKKRFTGGARSI